MQALTRFKLALTEDNPTIRPYVEARWAELVDGNSGSLEPALLILTGVHDRWYRLLNEMKVEDWKRTYFHPEHGRSFTLFEALGTYAWHCTQNRAKNRKEIQRKGGNTHSLAALVLKLLTEEWDYEEWSR
jgi:hypothetical protein